jgi:hypothetical protein
MAIVPMRVNLQNRVDEAADQQPWLQPASGAALRQRPFRRNGDIRQIWRCSLRGPMTDIAHHSTALSARMVLMSELQYLSFFAAFRVTSAKNLLDGNGG